MGRFYLFFGIMVNLLFYSVSFSQYNTWEYKSVMPTARTFLSSTVLDNKLYVIGGCPTTNATNKVEVYDYANDIWSSVSNLPAARCYSMSCSFQNKIYVFGGGPGMWSDAVKSVYVFDPQTGNWTQKSDMPYEIGAGGIAVVGDTIYLIGGALSASSPPSNKVMAYDPINENWTQKVSLPTPRNMLSACALDGKIYTFGGTNEDWENVFYKVVEVYDPASDTWTQKTDMITNRWGFVTCLVDGLIYAIGGRAGASSSTKNEVYNPQTDTWETKAPMLQARTGLAGAMIDGKIYVAGGHQGPPVVFLSSCEEYIPEISDVEEKSDFLPEKIELLQNYPNPFNPNTVISYKLSVSSEVSLKIYDLLGTEVATLVNEYKPAGKYEVTFDSHSGLSGIRDLPSGVYFYQLLVSALQSKDGKAGEYISTKKMTLMK